MLLRKIFNFQSTKSSNQFTFLEFSITSRFSTIAKSSSKMTDWQSEKEKFLNMDTKSKLNVKDAKIKVSQSIDEIPTWREYYKSNESRLKNLFEKSGAAKEFDESASHFPEGCDKVALWQGDITTLEIDAIVNAANNALLGGGGVDGAIHRAAGPFLKQECTTLGGCSTGDAKITGGYRLPAKYVIHTVGPRGEKPDLLESCYKKSLTVLEENDLRTVAFPCISTGIYGYPNEKAAHVVLRTVRQYLQKNHEKVNKIIFVCFLYQDIEIYEKLLQLYFPLETPSA
ncbi:macro domain-containing protein CT2219-like [Planococcus citri]|uniref:macro domain-containing protein CT2219-like n=1 Tax=Planococcus citri TaxID=170843 RepID=UPI0031F72975